MAAPKIIDDKQCDRLWNAYWSQFTTIIVHIHLYANNRIGIVIEDKLIQLPKAYMGILEVDKRF